MLQTNKVANKLTDLANENVVQNVMEVINSNKCVEEKRKRGRPPKLDLSFFQLTNFDTVNNRLSGMRFDRPDNKFSGYHDLLTKRGNKETINE
ncbi:hypothetical protein BpHYR1_005232 [Brachionus plicatilis]|uniref:Uncharacterized protein n=1 Tax=Brachionus plicatilis TaxID=10195 RepID=A0A3M7SA12_BRAPC|nr:hypothetical protein BpHYR1_005232 [Brachionus plicatilis]